MSWAKLDDAMCEHRKIKRALRKSRPAVALHFLGILHCSRYLTDGFVEDEYVEEVLLLRERTSALAALIEHGLWIKVEGGYQIHDYLDHNPTREKVFAQRAADAARKARGRQPESRGTPDAVRAESVRPVPSRPTPTPPLVPPGGNGNGTPSASDVAPARPSGRRQTGLRAYEEQMAAWSAYHFPGADPRAVSSAIGFLHRDSTAITAAGLRDRAVHNETWAAQLGLTPIKETA